VGFVDSIIDVENLKKSYGKSVALDGLNLHVRRGEIHGFLGPNGAGKSTTIRILLGLIRSSGGKATVFGKEPWAQDLDIHGRLAYVPGDVNLWPTLTGGEIIDVLGRLQGGFDPSKRTELIERFELDPTKKGGAYSKGNRQKVALVAAFSSDTELLVLDEPTSGLDPLMEGVFTACVSEARDSGRTVLLSSHILGEVDKLCDRITIVRAGRTVQSGELSELKAITGSHVSATTRRRCSLDGIPGIRLLEHDGLTVSFDVDSVHLDAAIAELSASGLLTLHCSPPSLEDLFLEHYTQQAELTR
jgi:ABC-2 type transport system ATP-binding protein